MKKEELISLLESSGMPYAYSHFEKEMELPFIAYIQTSAPHISANDKVYVKNSEYDIEIYTEEYDPEVEKTFEALIERQETYYEKVPAVYIKDEDMFKVTYTVIVEGE